MSTDTQAANPSIWLCILCVERSSNPLNSLAESSQGVVSDGCEPVSARTMRLSPMPRRDRATQPGGMWGDEIVRDRACGDRHGTRGWREGLGGKALKNHRSHPNVALCCAHGEWQSLNLGVAPPPENDGRGKPRPSFGDRKRTSERRRPLGRSLAMSGGRTTCLSRAGRRKKRGVSRSVG